MGRQECLHQAEPKNQSSIIQATIARLLSWGGSFSEAPRQRLKDEVDAEVVGSIREAEGAQSMISDGCPDSPLRTLIHTPRKFSNIGLIVIIYIHLHTNAADAICFINVQGLFASPYSFSVGGMVPAGAIHSYDLSLSLFGLKPNLWNSVSRKADGERGDAVRPACSPIGDMAARFFVSICAGTSPECSCCKQTVGPPRF